MTSKQLLDEIESLPGDEKQVVAELVALLRRKQVPDSARKPRQRKNPADSDLVGIWKDRDDLTAEWLRELRRREWREPV